MSSTRNALTVPGQGDSWSRVMKKSDGTAMRPQTSTRSSTS